MLTCPWHRRDAEPLAERLRPTIYVPPADADDPSPVQATIYSAGDVLPLGVEAIRGLEDGDLVLRVERHRAVALAQP